MPAATTNRWSEHPRPMPGLCAVFATDGRPAERTHVAAALGRLTSPASERAGLWMNGPVALAATALAATGQDSSPLAVDGDLAVVVDARFDDTPRLGAWLDGPSERALSRAELVLAAYRRWGVECLAELRGDFAFVLWDGARQRLFAARDVLGVRQLVWTREGERVLLASSVGSLVALLGRRPDPHWPFLADLIARRHDRWREETCLSGILRLPAAHALTVEAGRWERRRWTRLRATAEVARARESDQVAAFGQALGVAVATRLAGSAPVGLLVSGGLDSSALAALANEASSEASAAPVRLYSMAFEATPGADEGEFREALFDHLPRLPAVRVPCDDRWALCEFEGDGGFLLDEPERELTRGLVAHLLRRLVADGCGVVMGGHWGDQVLASGLYGAASALADVPLGSLGRELPYFARHSRHRRPWLLAFAIASHLAGGDPRRGFRGGRSGEDLPSRGAELIHAELTSGVTAASLASLDRLGRWLGVEWRLPFLDRGVIECALALRPSLRAADGVTKGVLRRALADRLPSTVLERRGRAFFDGLIERGLRLHERDRIARLLDQPRVVSSGLVSPRALGSLVCNYFEREVAAASYRDLAAILCVEAWLRHRETSSSVEVAPLDQVWETGGG